MSIYRIDGATLTDIANAIRSKTGATLPLFPAEMAASIALISGDGGSAEISFLLDDNVTTIALADVVNLSVDENVVAKVLLNGITIWGEEYKYKNLVDIATTTPGGTEIYDGVGYKNGYRWSSSSKADKNDYVYGRVTGWMPYKQGLLRIKNFGLDRNKTEYAGYVTGYYLVLYKTDGSYQTITGNWTTKDDDYEEITLNYTGVAYFKISGYCTRNYQGTPLLDPPIVTIDEEITE